MICARSAAKAACVGVIFDESYYKDLQRYNEKRNYFCRRLDEIGLQHNTPQGNYFVMMDISDPITDKFKGWTDMQFCEWMIAEIGVAACRVQAFMEPVNNLIGYIL